MYYYKTSAKSHFSVHSLFFKPMPNLHGGTHLYSNHNIQTVLQPLIRAKSLTLTLTLFYIVLTQCHGNSVNTVDQ